MKFKIIIILLLIAYVSAQENYFDISLFASSDTLQIKTNSSYDIYGYQFQISNLTLLNCQDPNGIFSTAENNGLFTGFSLSGNFLPSGTNTILTCLIVESQVTESEGACIDSDSMLISLQSSGGLSGQIPISEIDIENCLFLDCNGILGGAFSYDLCISEENPNGICNGNNLSCTDCNGDINGEAYIDGCGNCVGGGTGNETCITDCNGIDGGTAYINNCGDCVNENDVLCIQGCDGNWFNDGSHLVVDDCGVCNGDNLSCSDCAGVPNGTSLLDCLGNCGDPLSESFAKEDLCGNCSGSCTSVPIINCECSLIIFNGIETINCNGECNPSYYTDPCFIWNYETWINDTTIIGNTEYYDEGETINDANGNGLLDRGCYDCGGNFINDENFDFGNIFKEYSCSIAGLTYDTDYYCNALINNNLIDEGQCLSNEGKSGLIDDFTLLHTYPNPFNPTTTITYSVKNAGNINIDIYNVLGQHIYSLVNDYHYPGVNYEILWNSDNQSNIPISSGIYFIKAESSENILIQQVTLSK